MINKIRALAEFLNKVSISKIQRKKKVTLQRRKTFPQLADATLLPAMESVFSSTYKKAFVTNSETDTTKLRIQGIEPCTVMQICFTNKCQD